MSEQSVRPEGCPPGRHYTGIVRTNTGTHGRILQRSSGYWELPWLYYTEDYSTPLFAADSDVSDLQEIDPFVNDQLRRSVDDVNRLQRELDDSEWVVAQLKKGINGMVRNPEPLTEKRVRELAREEINKTSWQFNGLTITHAARDREDHNL